MTFEITLFVTTLLCGLVAGFLVAFAVVVMPGIARLGDGAFIRAFQAIDAVIQESNPLFILLWLGAMLGTVASLVLGVRELDGSALLTLGIAVATFLLAVQLPTLLVNVPLNNRLVTLDPSSMDDAALSVARTAFEPAWNRWNAVRTVASIVTTGLLMATLASR